MMHLYNDDCLSVLRDIKSGSVDLILTDPPYRTTSRGSAGTMGGYWKGNMARSGQMFKYNTIDCTDWMPEFYRVLKEDAHCYVMCNNKNLFNFLDIAQKCGFVFVKSIIWSKGNKICGKYYMGCYEHILMFRKGKDKPINNCSTPDILRVPIKKLKGLDGKNLHDTEKPVSLMKILILNSSNKGETVLDPFMGIGGTGVACQMTNRNFMGIEIDKKYYDIALKRMECNGNAEVSHD